MSILKDIQIATNVWSAKVEVRKIGAIGLFEERYFQTRADDRETAIKWLIEDLNRHEGLEVRAITYLENLRPSYTEDENEVVA